MLLCNKNGIVHSWVQYWNVLDEYTFVNTILYETCFVAVHVWQGVRLPVTTYKGYRFESL
jgi:hypothetical protein